MQMELIIKLDCFDDSNNSSPIFNVFCRKMQNCYFDVQYLFFFFENSCTS